MGCIVWNEGVETSSVSMSYLSNVAKLLPKLIVPADSAAFLPTLNCTKEKKKLLG